MYPDQNPEKQAPDKTNDRTAEKESQSTPGRRTGSDRPDDDQIFRDWASI